MKEILNLKNERGATLFIVLIVVMILMILSTVLVFAMTTEGKQAIRHDNKTQAYYYARSGVEIALKRYTPDDVDYLIVLWGNIEDDNKFEVFEYATEEEYENATDLPEKNDIYPIWVTLQRLEDEDLDIRLKIESIGHYQGQEELIRFFIPYSHHGGNGIGNGNGNDYDIPDEFDIEPISEREDWEEGADGNFYHSGNDDISWTDPNGHQIIDTNGEIQVIDKPVQFKADIGNEILSLPHNDSRFKAPEIHFESPLKLNPHTSLHLYSNIVIFHNDVLMQNNSRLCFNLYENEEVGYVYFKEGLTIHNQDDIPAGIYTFSNKVCIPNDTLSLYESDNDNGAWGGGIWD